jgi:hypothetical protein
VVTANIANVAHPLAMLASLASLASLACDRWCHPGTDPLPVVSQTSTDNAQLCDRISVNDYRKRAVLRVGQARR